MRGNQRVKLYTRASDLTKEVLGVLSIRNYDTEYLSYILTQRLNDKKRLDQQFNRAMKISYNLLGLSLLLKALLQGTLKHIKITNDLLSTYNFRIIITVILVVLAVDCYSYLVSDADYYRRQIILNAVKKYQIENKH